MNPGTKQILTGITVIAGSLLLPACGGGSGGGGGSLSLGGTAAVGTPIVSAILSFSCAGGSKLSSTITDSAGVWTATLTGQALPCVVELSGGTVNGAANPTFYHSIATAVGTVNVTPITDLVVANLAGMDPTAWFALSGSNPATLRGISATQVNTAMDNVAAVLGGLSMLGTNNPISTVFTPMSGNATDDMLTALSNAETASGSAVPDHATLVGMMTKATPTVPASFGINDLWSAFVATPSGSTATSPTTSGSISSPVVLNYFDFNYLQDVNGVASSTATITDYGVSVAGSMSFGPALTKAIFTPTSGGGYSWGAYTGSGFFANTGDINVPAIAMICQSTMANGGTNGLRSTDVIVTTSALAVTRAASLAGMTFTANEDCVAISGASLVFDANGNATYTNPSGGASPPATVTVSDFDSALTGIPNTSIKSGGGYVTFNAYSVIDASANNATSYILVEHGATSATGLTTGYVRIWK